MLCALFAMCASSARAEEAERPTPDWSYTVELGPNLTRGLIVGSGVGPASGGWRVRYEMGVSTRYHVIDGLAWEIGGLYSQEGFVLGGASGDRVVRAEMVRLPLAMRIRVVDVPKGDFDVITGPEFGVRIAARETASDAVVPQDLTDQTNLLVWGWHFGVAYDYPVTEHTWLGARLRATYDFSPIDATSLLAAPPSGRVHLFGLHLTVAFRYDQ